MERRAFIFKSTGVIALSAGGLLSGTGSVYPKKTISGNLKETIMNTNRIKSFDVPHKGIRNGLSQLSLLSGKTNYNNPEEVEQLNRLGKEVFLLLNVHAQDENDVTLKHLEEKMKGASLHDLEDHARIEAVQSGLEKMLDDIYENSKNRQDVSMAGSAFYSLLADFHADYLNHMSEEERFTQQLLWDNFTDEELAAHRTEIMKKLHPDILLLWFKYIAPAQSHTERVVLFKGFKANAPEALFTRSKQVLSEALTAAEYASLMNELE